MAERNKEIKIIDLPKVEDERGNLSFIEGLHHLPFAIRRAYWIYDVPGGQMRGSHAFRRQEEFIVALSGSFDVVLDDGHGERRIHLCRSYKGVYVPPLTWRTLDNFSTNSLGLVLSSTHYDEEDYIWDFAAMGKERQCALSGVADSVSRSLDAVSGEAGAAPASLSALPTEIQGAATSYFLADCRLLQLPAFTELRRGWLTAVEARSEVLPFDLKRVFYIYDIPSGAMRGAHAHYQAWQFIISASSCFEVVLDDGRERKTVRLDRPFKALLVPPGIWCHLHDFSSAAVALVLTSDYYDAADYICDYDRFLAYRKSLQQS